MPVQSLERKAMNRLRGLTCCGASRLLESVERIPTLIFGGVDRETGFFELIGMPVPQDREETLINAAAIKPT